MWTRKTAMKLIEREYDIKMPIRTIGDYLKCLSFTPQNSAIRAYKQNPKSR
ncbi:winged helix-turn-helix domain-containing protein [Microbulbifer sp. EKSA005]|uniref:helix-turn-helix domain-containing protein n=1 Tax=Microbulbifer sp. EKSA005 TaxID=3243364 RepID=UPI0040411347